MKNTILFLLAVYTAFTGYSQRTAFNHVSLETINNRETLVFGTAREVNVRHYRIEASNDSLNFEVIATVAASGNSIMPVQYKYDVAAYGYTYYRVAKVEMNGDMPYSPIVMIKGINKILVPDTPAMTNTVVTNK